MIGRRLALALSLAGMLPVALNAQQLPPQWTHGATCYEVFIRSFKDSNGDGIGDIPGLIQKLDYINDGNPRSTTSLGARCIWLMPVMESPSYHGYDITNYYKVAHDYGTNADFKRLIVEAHKRDIKVLVDMVLNHVSVEHPWFQSAIRDTASPYRQWFRWSHTKPDEKAWSGDPWHKSPVRDEYYYGIFWSGMPDLNYENPAVIAEMKKVAKFWLADMGADGFRLDAVPYLVEEGGKLQNTEGTHRVLNEYETYTRSVKSDVFNIGEVSYPNDTLLSYYPEQLDSYFAFEVADSLIAAVREGSAKAMLAPVLRLQADVPVNRWSPFLSNHDQPRVRTKLGGDMARTRLATFVLLTMPGVPFMYYGDDIGMTGDKPDPRLRTPMQWNTGPGAGFTQGKPWEQLANDSATVSVAAEERNPQSVLNLARRLIHIRSRNSTLADGELIPLSASNDAVAAYIRRDANRVVLVVANLSGKPLTGVSLASARAAFPVGNWAVKSLLGGASAAAIHIAADGTLESYVPLTVLAPLEGYLFELNAAR